MSINNLFAKLSLTCLTMFAKSILTQSTTSLYLVKAMCFQLLLQFPIGKFPSNYKSAYFKGLRLWNTPLFCVNPEIFYAILVLDTPQLGISLCRAKLMFGLIRTASY